MKNKRSKAKRAKAKKGRRGSSRANLLALAKAHRKQGHAEAARRLEARAKGKKAPAGKGKRRGKKGRKYGRSKNPAATAAEAAPKAKKARKGKASKSKAGKPKASKRKAGKKRRGGRRGARAFTPKSGPKGVTVTFTSSGKGKRKNLRANVGALKAALKGSGAKYLDVRTGKLVKQAQIRTKNPSISGGAIVSLGVGAIVGVGVGEGMYRWLATRASAYDTADQKTENLGGWYGRAAATRIAGNSGTCLAAVGGAGVLVSGAGWLMLGSAPMFGAFVLGVGIGHIAVVAKRGYLYLIAKMSPVTKGNERTIGNRIAPEYAEPVRKSIAEQISYDGRNPQISESTKDGEVDLGSMDSLYGERAKWNLTPNEIDQPGGNTDEGPGAQAGLGNLEQRMIAARRKAAEAAGKGPAIPEGLRKMREGLAGPAASAASAFAQPALEGCDGNCPPDHDCGPGCKNREHKHDPSMPRPAETTNAPLQGLGEPLALPPAIQAFPPLRRMQPMKAAAGW